MVMIPTEKQDIQKMVREWSFLILGNGAEDFWNFLSFMKLSPLFCRGKKILRAIFVGCKTILLEKCG